MQASIRRFIHPSLTFYCVSIVSFPGSAGHLRTSLFSATAIQAVPFIVTLPTCIGLVAILTRLRRVRTTDTRENENKEYPILDTVTASCSTVECERGRRLVTGSRRGIGLAPHKRQRAHECSPNPRPIVSRSFVRFRSNDAARILPQGPRWTEHTQLVRNILPITFPTCVLGTFDSAGNHRPDA